MELALIAGVAAMTEPSAYHAALEYLFARTTGGVKFGLERTVALLEALGNPQRRYPSLHIAGTNGKGSSVATAEALLRGRGLRVARYTSPHLVDFRERIVVDGRPIGEGDVTEWIARHTPLVERLGATFFEATTAMALDWFGREAPDVALLETGLGGRLDATNVVDPIAAGVTSIAFDHMEYLGDTIEQIAAEKAGIFKRGRPAVVGGDDAGVAKLLAEAAAARGAAPIRVVGAECRLSDVEVSEGATAFTLRALGDERRLRTPLPGAHQAWNTAFALMLLDAAGPPYATTLADAERLLATVRVPGRFQHTGRYIFDVAHNADGAAVLARTIAAVAPPKPIVVLLSVLRDKDWRQMMENLAPIAERMILTVAPTSPRSRLWSLAEAVAHAEARAIPAEGVADFDAALARASALGATVLVTGSFHTVGDAMARLQVSPLPG